MESEHDAGDAEVEGVRDEAGALIVRVRGELDIASAGGVAESIGRLLDDATDTVIFDFSGLVFVDSSGLAVLVQAASRVKAVEVRGITPNVRRVFEISGLAETFGVA